VVGEDVKAECLSCVDGSFDIGVHQSNKSVEWFHIDGTLDEDGSLSLLVDNSKRVEFSSFLKLLGGDTEVHIWSKRPGPDHYFAKVRFEDLLASKVNNTDGAVDGVGKISAPMPGKVVRINASVGDIVKKDDVLIVMEAMKMQHSIRSPRDGELTELFCAEDSIVDDGFTLATVVAPSEGIAT
jgi:biotin carboxyl carrier protein